MKTEAEKLQIAFQNIELPNLEYIAQISGGKIF